jgi:hypothetical protein
MLCVMDDHLYMCELHEVTFFIAKSSFESAAGTSGGRHSDLSFPIVGVA